VNLKQETERVKILLGFLHEKLEGHIGDLKRMLPGGQLHTASQNIRDHIKQLKGFEPNTSFDFLKDGLGGIGALAMREMLSKEHFEKSHVDDSIDEILNYKLK